MKKIFLLHALTILLVTHFVQSKDEDSNHHDPALLEELKDLLPMDVCGPIYGSKVMNGEHAFLEEFPWMALLFSGTPDDPSFVCGGTIIHEKFILTAAHCFQDKEITHVRLGEHDISKTKDCRRDNYCTPGVQDIRIKNYTIYPDSQLQQHTENDIALVELNASADFGYSNVKPICLPINPTNYLSTGKYGIISGWGFKEDDSGFEILGKLVDILRKGYVKVKPLSDCQAAPYKLTDRHICARGDEGQDSCDGDSGGPLMSKGPIDDGTVRFIQYGIVSYGYCTSLPAIYSNVRSYLPWVLEVMKTQLQLQGEPREEL